MAIEANQTHTSLHETSHEQSQSTSQATFAIEGMTCASCSMRVEKGLKKVSGVIDAQVDLATERGTVTYNPEQTGIEQLVQKVEAVGYKAMPVEPRVPQAAATTMEKSVARSASAVSLNIQHEDERTQRAEAEHDSEHPLAAAIVEGAKARGLALTTYPERFTALAGRGLEARVEGHDLLIGTRMLLREHSIDPSVLEEQLAHLEGQGKTAMLVALDGSVVGAVAVADTVKVGSREAIQQLHAQGISVWMITGDNRRTAQAIALQVGIAPEYVLAEVLPEDKSHQVKRLQEQGLVVAFAGDGINDAPALVQADAGIAIEASDITLVKGNLKSIATALALSRATMRTIRQNLFWAFAYNVILIPLAILSPLIPFLKEQAPIFAATAMALSSVTVVSNSLRLRRFGRSSGW